MWGYRSGPSKLTSINTNTDLTSLPLWMHAAEGGAALHRPMAVVVSTQTRNRTETHITTSLSCVAFPCASEMAHSIYLRVRNLLDGTIRTTLIIEDQTVLNTYKTETKNVITRGVHIIKFYLNAIIHEEKNLKCLEFTHSVVRAVILSIKTRQWQYDEAVNRPPSDFRFICAICSHFSCKFIHVEMCNLHICKIQ